MANKKIYIFALAAQGQGISGSDRIFIEFSKNWSKTYPITLHLCNEGYEMCVRYRLKSSNINYKISKTINRLGFLLNYIFRIAQGIRLGLDIKLDNSQNTILYSASEFWMDSLPALILKIRYPKVRWVAGWYQTAPPPWQGFAEGRREKRYYLSALVYWLVQLPIKPLISNIADFILVNNALEKNQFKKQNRFKRVIEVLGAIDVKEIQNWKKKFKHIPKKYDAVFQGRFHPQKGILELVKIWQKLIQKKKNAKLVMIGDGSLMQETKLEIKKAKLSKHIILVGYLFDGEEKYKIFSQSRIVVHPSFYDSGGIASLEAMAFGLPAVGFKLKSYKQYYTQGMVKVKVGDIDSFAKSIQLLLSNKIFYAKKQREVFRIINKKLSWEYRSRQILGQVLE